MKFIRHTLRFWTFAGLLIAGSVAGAQQQSAALDTSAVPAALVEALVAPGFEFLSMFFGGRSAKPRILVGKLPSAVAERISPLPGTTILGGLDSPNYAMGVFRSSLATDSVVRVFRNQLLRRGWLVPKGNRFPVGGFRSDPATTNGPNDDELLLCSNGASMSISASRERAETKVVASYSAASPTQCIFESGRLDPEMMPRYPSLDNPPRTGTGRFFDCNAQQGNTLGTTYLKATTDLPGILDHYGRQLTDSGYTRKDLVSESRTWTRPDSAGNIRELTLTATVRATSPGCTEVTMTYR